MNTKAREITDESIIGISIYRKSGIALVLDAS